MDLFNIGLSELIFIFVIALMIFGPRRLPEIAAKAGKFVAALRNMSGALMTEWQREIGAANQLEDLRQARENIEGIKQDLQQARQDIGQIGQKITNETKQAAAESTLNPSKEGSKPLTQVSKTASDDNQNSDHVNNPSTSPENGTLESAAVPRTNNSKTSKSPPPSKEESPQLDQDETQPEKPPVKPEETGGDFYTPEVTPNGSATKPAPKSPEVQDE